MAILAKRRVRLSRHEKQANAKAPITSHPIHPIHHLTTNPTRSTAPLTRDTGTINSRGDRHEEQRQRIHGEIGGLGQNRTTDTGIFSSVCWSV
jgi:hypothetical protein